MQQYTKIHKLFTDIKYLPGIGPKRAEAFARIGCRNIRDLLYLYPINCIDRRRSPALNKALDGQVISVVAEVKEHLPSGGVGKTRKLYKILCQSDSGFLYITYFNAKPGYLQDLYPTGSEVTLSSKVEIHGNTIQMVHPDIVLQGNRLPEVQIVEPVYPLTYALNNKTVAKAVTVALPHVQPLEEWIPSEVLAKHRFPTWHQAIKDLHRITSDQDLEPSTPAKNRLAFDEILAQQIRLQMLRQKNRSNKTPLKFTGELLARMRGALPFTLTAAQEQTIAEISQDQASQQRMTRLVQGDVGSGKTLVALAAMLNCAEADKQAALMAPTEILARQHYAKLEPLCAQLGIACVLLISKMKAAEKKQALAVIASGAASIVIGTHALIQEGVEFKDLALAIIDEQHRFGVQQRQNLMRKGSSADFLMMTATPIPRTLTMVNYGDLDVSVMREKPAGRKAIQTSVISANKMGEMLGKLPELVAKGEKIYWLCPLVEESEKMELTDVVSRFESIQQLLPGQVGMIHGQMKPEEKDEQMELFLSGKHRVLVATTVIEVGVDVPDATVMLIEHAERFGLSQLHQLRGRVGRGEKEGRCILLYKPPISSTTQERLKAMRASDDGFILAQKDLELRGGGDVVGRKQSGIPDFQCFQPIVHQHLIEEAYLAAKAMLAEAHPLIPMLLQLYAM
jgi:ATP-dependent DNA helicase RecG